MEREKKYLAFLPRADEREYDLPLAFTKVWESLSNYWRELFSDLAVMEPNLGLHSLVNMGVQAILVEWYIEKAQGKISREGASFLRWSVLGQLFHDVGKLGVMEQVTDSVRVIRERGECCGLKVDELSRLRKNHPWLGGYGLRHLEEVVGRVPGIEWLEELNFMAFGHHEELDGGLQVKSYPRSKSRETNPWRLLSLLFAQLADSLTANVLDRSYREIDPLTGRRNVNWVEGEEWLRALLADSVLRKIFDNLPQERIEQFRASLLGLLGELRRELEVRFSSEVCLRGRFAQERVEPTSGLLLALLGWVRERYEGRLTEGLRI